MTLLEMRMPYEQIKKGWRAHPPAEHRFDLERLQQLQHQAQDSADEGTEQLSVEIDDLIGQITSSSIHAPHAPAAGGFVEPSDAM